MNELFTAAHFAKKMIQSKQDTPIQKDIQKDSKHKDTLICLHGYMSHTSIFDDFKTKFQDYLHVVCIQLPTLSCNVPKLAQIVEDEIKNQDIKNYSILGHSLGSIVALYHQLFYAKIKAKKIICVASPICGSNLSRFALGPIRIDLQTNSIILREIRSRVSSMRNALFIQAQDDILINPLTCDTFSPVIFVNIGHLGILLHPLLIHICQDILC